MNPIERIKQINEKNAEDERQAQNHKSLIDSQLQTQETVVRSFSALVDYLERRVGKTEVVNQLKEIGTPDALKVVEAVNSLHATLKTHENTDLSEITSVMKQVLDEAKKIPKTEINIPKVDIPSYVAQFKSLTDAVKAVEKVVKAQKLVAEAPVVNVDAPVINLDAPDLKPLQNSIKEVVEAVQGIVIPEYKTDNKSVEDLIKKSNKLLKDILEKPVGGGGGGGGGRATPYQDSNDIPAFVTLASDGSVPVSSTATDYAVAFDSDATYDYFGFALPGTATSSASWKVFRLSDDVKQYADGNANFDNQANNMPGLSYS